MKKISFCNHKTLIGWLLMAMLTPSCKKLIGIPANPPTAITVAQQFGDSATLMTAVAGVYTYSAYGQGFTFNDGYITTCTGLSSDELTTTNTGDLNSLEFYSYSVTPINSYVSTLWADPYTGLYPVNAILKGITGNSALSASLITQITGEMKVLRALYYFNLVNVFGGVPLVTSTDYKTTASIPRAPVDSVYGLILADLADAQQALPADYPSSGRVRPNLYTVLSLLAKVHLYRQEWQNAYDAANTVIGSGVYSLEPDLNNVFLDGSNEAIWQIPANGSYSVTTDANNFIPYSSGVIPTYLVNTFLLNAFETGDQRSQKWITNLVANTGSGNQNYPIPYKYKNRQPGTTVEDYMVFRLGEQYLIRAEAAAQLGNTSSALTDLNQVRARAGLSASTASSQADVLTAIMHERQTELFCEWGNRWFDLKRTGTINAVLSAEKTGWQPNAALYPVPRTQLLYNTLLTQNPGY